MRLNWFLPFLRKSIKGPPRTSPGLLVRLLTFLLPSRWLSDTRNGKPGPLRRILRKLGPSWSSSPFRRLSQTFFFLAFLVLFLWVAWPYSAKPAKLWPGWVPTEVNPETGSVTLETEHAPDPPLNLDDVLVLVDTSATLDPTDPHAKFPTLGRFELRALEAKKLQLAPVAPLEEKQIALLNDSLGPWTLYEKSPDDWPSHYADDLAAKEKIHAEAILIIDPLVSISTAIAAKSWVWSLVWASVIIGVCILIPRGFCGYICPLGSLIDLFDWSIARRVKKFNVPDDGWWVHIKYYLLTGVLVAGLCGVLLSGFVAAIPVITRGLLFIFKPFHDGIHRGWHNVPPINAGHVVSLALFFGVLFLGFMKPRFWCKYVCPSGAVFSVFNLFRATERKVESSCINCNKCVEICPFDAIKPDFTTRVTDCTLCQSCGGVCPVDAIKFVDRGNRIELKILNDPPTHETRLGRRGFIAAGVGLGGALVGGVGAALGIKGGARLDDPTAWRPVRPPGSIPEQEFLQACIRCGECFKACPNDVLQPLGFKQGLEGLWTPHVVADWSGCEVSCNACGQVCPTGAIRALPLEEKKAARMGLAIVNLKTCLPYSEREACQLCVDECVAAGYHAIEFINHGTKMDADGNPIEGTGFLAPVVRGDKCVGCGLCQTRCYAINVAQKKLIDESAIIIEAGEGKEDRLMRGSYVALRVKDRLP